MNFLLTTRGELKRAPKGENRHQFLDRAPKGDRLHQFDRLVQAVAFTHPQKGDHVVYVDKAVLDHAGIPPMPVYERIANLIEQVI